MRRWAFLSLALAAIIGAALWAGNTAQAQEAAEMDAFAVSNQAGNGIIVTWAEPTVSGTIHRYSVRWKSGSESYIGYAGGFGDNARSSFELSTARSTTIPKSGVTSQVALTAGTAYTIQVRAHNSSGTVLAEKVLNNVRPAFTAPPVPDLTWRKASSSSVNVVWPTVASRTYSVHRKAAFAADSTYTTTGISTDASASFVVSTLSGLTADTHYEVRVQIKNGSNVTHQSVISVAAGSFRPAPAGCVDALGTVPTSGIQSKTSFWHLACASRYAGPIHLSRYFSITTGSSGKLAVLVESCTEANLKIWKGNDVDTAKEGGLNKFTWVPELASGSSSGHTGGTFKLGRATTLIRHLGETDGEGNPTTRSKLTPAQLYTIEVSSPYPGQLGNFKLQYGNDDAGFEATPGFCSDGTTNSRMKSAPTGYTRCTDAFPLNSCLSYTDPVFWSTLSYRQQHDVLWGIYGSVWPGVTGPTGASGPQPDNPPTVSDTSAFKTHYATVGESFSLTLPTADPGSGDGEPYEYLLWHKGAGKSFNDQAINGLSFNAATRTLSGTPAAEGTWELSYVVHDGDANRNAATDAFRERTNLKIVVVPGGNAVGDGNSDGPSGDGEGDTQQQQNEPANRAPTFDAGIVTTLSVDENIAAGTKVGSAITATDADEDALTYSLSGTDAASFDIGATTGQITTKAGVTYNYEVKSSYSLAVGVSDGKLSDSVDITVSLNDVNEAPTVSDKTQFKNHAAKVGESFSLTLPAADANSGDGRPYKYLLWHRGAGKSFSDQAINGLSFDAATRTLSGTPTAAGVWKLSYVVHDKDSDRSVEDRFRARTNLQITVAP